MRIKVSEAEGPVLVWLVAKCEDFDTRNNYRVWVTLDNEQITFDCGADDWEHAYEQALDAYPDGRPAAVEPLSEYNPLTNWAQGGPILEREHLQPSFQEHGKYKGLWACNKWVKDRSGATVAISQYDPTLLIAAMRCYVASKLGDEVEVPEELL